jgi:hypothetical protein
VIQSVVNQGAALSVTSATPLNVTSVTLTPGSWNISFGINALQASGGTLVTTALDMALSTSSATLPSSTFYGDTRFSSPIGPNINGNLTLTSPILSVDIASTQTYYLVYESTFSGASMNISGKIVATRR